MAKVDKPYGYELIVDLENADVSKFNRNDIEDFLVDLCEIIDMKRANLHWWDYDGEPEEKAKAPAHLKGTSAVQFITTSTIVIHTLDDLKKVFIDIFSCKHFEPQPAQDFCVKFFGGDVKRKFFIERG
jgi:S-adenosylmethionine/arginine decarboxylase-like enzyme